MDSSIAIKAEGITKIYPIYNTKNDRMKEALSLTRRKYHTDFHALRDISFEIKKGETIGIIGQNGSGKSTLLKILTGVLSSTSGKIEVHGKISALLELGAGFNPEMSGLENIYLNGTIMGYTRAEMEQKVPEIIKFADIGTFITQPVKTYSSGMFARLAFAVAINVEPDILIVDEALSVGDAFFQNKCFRKMDELQQSGITILLVSHELSTIKQMCSRVMWLDNGILKSLGEKNFVCEQYFSYQINKQNTSIGQAIGQCVKKIECEKRYEAIFPKLKSSNERNIFSEKVKLVSFFIKNQSKTITNILEVNHKYTFHLVSQNFEDIENAIFGIRFDNVKGLKVYGTNTFLAEVEKTIQLKKGTFTEVIFSTTLPRLIRGEYLITLAIIDGTQQQHKVLIWLNNAIKVEIVNDGLTDTLFEMECNINTGTYEEGQVSLTN